MPNPFLDTSFLPAWSRLTPDHISAAVDEAIALGEAAFESISNVAGPRTYENTLLAFERSTDPLNRVWGLVSHLDSVDNSPELREALRANLPKVSSFFAKIYFHDGLWKAMREFADSPAGRALTGVKKRFLDETLTDFRESGADLSAEKKKRLEEIETLLAERTQKYSENVLDSTNAYELVIEDEARLAGLPPTAKNAAREDALRKGHGTPEQPKWRFTLHQPSLTPALTYLEDEALRKELWQASTKVGNSGDHDNSSLIWEILRLRQEKATLLGQSHFPDLILSRRMARNGAIALGFINELHRRVQPAFRREAEELRAFKASRTGCPEARLEPWDMAYWAEKLRIERYDFDEEALRPYFPMEGVLKGMFELSGRLFGFTVKEVPSCCPRKGGEALAGAVEVWHPECKFYELHDSSGRHLGSFYADWHPRETKRGGAWMNYLHTAEPAPRGTRGPHLGLMVGNMTKPSGGNPALLTHGEVETVFHEFGHLIHHLLSDVEVKSFNGTNVPWDFVELPSQIMENWCWERSCLDLFARHHETGAAIPDDLFNKLEKAKNYNAALDTVRQLAFGKMDLELHHRAAREDGGDLDGYLRGLLDGWRIPTGTDGGFIIRRFTHLFGSSVGYAAAYYSYKWSEVLDADAFTRFKKEGVLNPATGRSFRETILEKGNSEPADKLFRDFMGRDPDPEALLVRSGLA